MMILPGFSEFSLGYAFTDNLVNKVLSGIKAVPIFPSLQVEGKAGGGFDVEIPACPAPLFLQFKLPQVIQKGRKIWAHNLESPYYRIHLMRRRHSTQHASLLRHALRSKMVFYVAPEFDQRDKLSEFYQQGCIPARSAFFDPKDIGPLDDESHHIAYREGGDCGWFCSRPRRIPKLTGDFLVQNEILKAVAKAPERKDHVRFLDEVAEGVVGSALEEELGEDAETLPGLDRAASERRRLSPFRDRLGAARFAAFVSNLYLDCQLVIVGRGT